MSVSDEVKQDLVQHFPGTLVKDWKRSWKRTIDGQECRFFENRAAGICAYVIDDGETILEGGDMLCAISPNSDEHMPGKTVVSVSPRRFWLANKCLPDWHMQWLLENIYAVKKDYLEEMAENMLVCNDPPERVRAVLLALSIIPSPEMQAFVDGIGAGDTEPVQGHERDTQKLAWERFKSAGKVAILYSKPVVYDQLIFDWIEEDEKESDTSFSFVAGYYSTKDEELIDSCDVPDEVFEQMFEGKLGDVVIEWNGSESTHYVEDISYSDWQALKVKLAEVFVQNGWKQATDDID